MSSRLAFYLNQFSLGLGFVKKDIIKFTEIIGKGKRPFLKLFIGIDKLAEDENTINWWIIGAVTIFSPNTSSCAST